MNKDKRGFYAIVDNQNDYVYGIHYFDGRTLTERLSEYGAWVSYNPLCKTPSEFNNTSIWHTCVYLGE